MKNTIIAFILVSFFNLSSCPSEVADSNSENDHSIEIREEEESEEESDALLNKQDFEFDDFGFDVEEADSIYLDDEVIDTLKV